LRRAAGLALIAAAVAAKPAASISRLIAAFANLSTVDSLDFELEVFVPPDCERVLPLDFERVLPPVFFVLFRVLDLAIANLPTGPR
jgi:hypothetical protein